jgi:hypothetical protein
MAMGEKAKQNNLRIMTNSKINKNQKQAILITAYKNFGQLMQLINFFDDSFNIYVHIDKKNRPEKSIEEKIRAFKTVKLLSYQYKVNWGGRNHLKAYLLLAEEALKDEENKYFHLITGQDFPVQSLQYIKDITNQTTLKDHIAYTKMPCPNLKNGGMDRITYYHFYDLYNFKKAGWSWIKWPKLIWKLQALLHINRPISEKIPPLYFGSTYWSLTRDTLDYVVDFTRKKPLLFKRLRFTFCPEEIYFQTVIMNSHYANNVVNDNLRFINWNKKRKGDPGSPAILDLDDYEAIKSSNKLFARKFQGNISEPLKIKIIDSIH